MGMGTRFGSKKKVARRKKQEIKSDLSTMMGCLLVTGHLLTAGHPLCQSPSAGIRLFSLPRMHHSFPTRARPREQGPGQEDTARGCSALLLPLGSPSSPPSHLVPGFAASTGLGGDSESFADFQWHDSSFSLETLIVRASCSTHGLQHSLGIGLRPRSVSLDASERFQMQE